MRIFAYLPNVVVAVLLFIAGSVLAKFLARGALIGAVWGFAVGFVFFALGAWLYNMLGGD